MRDDDLLQPSAKRLVRRDAGHGCLSATIQVKSMACFRFVIAFSSHGMFALSTVGRRDSGGNGRGAPPRSSPETIQTTSKGRRTGPGRRSAYPAVQRPEQARDLGRPRMPAADAADVLRSPGRWGLPVPRSMSSCPVQLKRCTGAGHLRSARPRGCSRVAPIRPYASSPARRSRRPAGVPVIGRDREGGADLLHELKLGQTLEQTILHVGG